MIKESKKIIWFKLTTRLNKMLPLRSETLPLSVDLPSGVELRFYMRGLMDDKKFPELCCNALFHQKVNNEVSGMFEKLAKGYFPQDNPPLVSLPYKLSLSGEEIGIDGEIPESCIIPLNIMPHKFQFITQDVRKKLYFSITNFVKTLRWVQGNFGEHHPFRHVSYEWSEDKESWSPIPQEVTTIFSLTKPIDLGKRNIDLVLECLKSEKFEPVGHELVLEAFEVAVLNPRSALLIGFSGLETGLKNYVRFLVPHSEPILENIQSPPILTIIENVIPALHRALGHDVPDFSISKTDKELLRNWNVQRNKVAHGIQKSVDTHKLREFLSFVRKFLYKLDVCCGYGWAKSFITEDS